MDFSIFIEYVKNFFNSTDGYATYGQAFLLLLSAVFVISFLLYVLNAVYNVIKLIRDFIKLLGEILSIPWNALTSVARYAFGIAFFGTVAVILCDVCFDYNLMAELKKLEPYMKAAVDYVKELFVSHKPT